MCIIGKEEEEGNRANRAMARAISGLLRATT